MRIFSLLILLILNISCASKSDISYKTYNESLNEVLKKQKTQLLISDYTKIPKFNDLRKKMAPGFLFSLYHPSDEKLRGRFRADFKGILRLPYNVRINVKFLSFYQLRDKVLQAYSKYFQQGVENVEFKLIYKQYFVEVRGYIKKSGRYLVTRNEGIDKIIDKAGGLKSSINEAFYKASIKQRSKSYAINLNQFYQNNTYANAFRWTGGDSVYITEQDESEMGESIPIVTVLGGVIEPGKILYKNQAHLFYYISKSGGTVPSLAYGETFVIRNTVDGIKKIQFNITDMNSIPNIMANDIILLQAEKRTTTDKIFERTSQISSILLTALLIFAL